MSGRAGAGPGGRQPTGSVGSGVALGAAGPARSGTRSARSPARSGSGPSCSGTNGSFAREDLAGPGPVEGALPAGDDEDGHTVAEQVGGDPHRVHDAVDAEQQGDGSGRDHPESGGGGGEREERRTGDTGHALAGQHEDEDHGDLLAEGEVDADGLGDEERADGEVDGGAVEVEGVAGGQHEPHRVVAAAACAGASASCAA